jgi:hypothetical protein
MGSLGPMLNLHSHSIIASVALSSRSLFQVPYRLNSGSLPGGREVRTAATFDDRVSESVRAQRFRTLLLTLLGAMVLAITMVGVAGVTAHGVAIRTRAGVSAWRSARGQDRSCGCSPGRAPHRSGSGVGGAMMAWWSVRLLEKFLFGLVVRDPLTFDGAAMLLLVAGFMATWRSGKMICL